jgi:hypothetical protein
MKICLKQKERHDFIVKYFFFCYIYVYVCVGRLVCAPTGAGKTIIALLAMMKTIKDHYGEYVGGESSSRSSGLADLGRDLSVNEEDAEREEEGLKTDLLGAFPLSALGTGGRNARYLL